MFQNCRNADKPDFRVNPGEEVSIGNAKSRNVHLLAINHDKFIEGSGDSAERWFRNKPQHHLTEIKTLHSDSNLFIAAHPFEKIPFMQKITLRRGNWKTEDFENSGITFLQAINSAEPDDVFESIEKWKNLLLKGYKYFIVAGNDAHGNFNVMRQIKSPFWKLFSSQKQTFGKFFTAFKYSENDPINGLKTGNVIVSNGPYLNFSLKKEEHLFPIGSTVEAGKYELIYETETSAEFGEISEIITYIGNLRNRKEQVIYSPAPGLVLDFESGSYIRISMKTDKGGIAFTNPVWIK
jgi:hypothetical protein